MNTEVDICRNISINKLLGVPESNRRRTILCVFHQDKHPSLVIYPNGGGYHCFSCGAHGNNAIDFVMGLGYDFNNAIKELRDYA